MNSTLALTSTLILIGLVPSARAQECVLEQAKLLPQSQAAGQMFGKACAVSGDTCAAITANGTVSVHVRDAGTWTHEQSFATGQTAASFANTTTYLDVDGDTLVVGDPSRFVPPSGFDAGAVGVYVRNGATWSLQATLTAPTADASAGDAFGHSVSLSGDHLIVGAPYDDELGSDAGAAYAFSRSGTTWSLDSKLTTAGAAPGQNQGFAVDFDGARTATTGPGGRTAIWALQGSSWTQEAELLAGGRMVAVEGARAALWDDGSCFSGGLPLSTFERIGSTWTQGANVLTHPGGAIALRQGRLVVGQPANTLCSSIANATRIYSPLGTSWAVDATAGKAFTTTSAFGRSIAFDGSTLLIAGASVEGAASDPGAVFVYSIGADAACPTDYCTAKLNSLGCAPAMYSSGSSSAAAPSGFNLGVGRVLNNKVGLCFYGTSGRASSPFLGGVLCVAPPTKRAPLASTGGAATGADCSGWMMLDMNAFAAGALGGNPSPLLSVPGTIVDVQWWARDPGFAPPNNVQLSAGQEYTVLP